MIPRLKELFIKEIQANLKQKFGNDFSIFSGGDTDGAERYVKKYALELGLQYEEYPPFHEVHNMYCTMPSSRYSKDYSIKNFFARNKIIAGTSDFVVGFIPEGVEANGTMNTIDYAKKFDKKYIIIN